MTTELAVIGEATAGISWPAPVRSGTAVRITTGAPLPSGCDTVAPREMCHTLPGHRVGVRGPLSTGSHIRRRAEDTRAGDVLAPAGTWLTPGRTGQLAAAGVDKVTVTGRPRAALVAVGDEIADTRRPLGPRQVYASNLVNLSAWLQRAGVTSARKIVKDDPVEIRGAIESVLESSDILITIGGAGGSHRDLVVPVLLEMGTEIDFRRVRMSPGKGTAAGGLGRAALFCLPGGPPACEMAFLQLVLPALRAMAGLAGPHLPPVPVRLTARVRSGAPEWTRFQHVALTRVSDEFHATPVRAGSRLDAMARADALVTVPEGVTAIEKGSTTWAQVLTWEAIA